MTQSSPESLGNVIDALMHQLGMQTKLKQDHIVALWPSIVGEPNRKHDKRGQN